MESRHGGGQTDEQGLYQRKRSDGVLTAYTRYVFGQAASEGFQGNMISFMSFEDESCS